MLFFFTGKWSYNMSKKACKKKNFEDKKKPKFKCKKCGAQVKKKKKVCNPEKVLT